MNLLDKKLFLGQSLLTSLALLLSPFALATEERINSAKVPHGSIIIDGKEGDSGWSMAGSNSLPYSIFDKAAAKDETVYQLVYDDEMLYIKFFASDKDIDGLRKKYDRRDNFGSNDDKIWVTIDPTGDGKLSQFFGVSAGCAISDGTNSAITGYQDLAPNYDIDVACSQGDDYWMAEVGIPFSELKYRKSPTNMKILVQRMMLREINTLFASDSYDSYNPCLMCSARQIEVDSPAKKINTRAVLEGFYGESSLDGVHEKRVDAGVTLGMPLGDATVVDLTFHPDYSQVDADQPYLSANSRFPEPTVENRPFFMEGGDILFAPLNSASSRSIVTPEYGAKIISRGENYNFLAIAARDSEDAYRVVPGAYCASLEKAFDPSDNLISRGSLELSNNFSLGMSANAKKEGEFHENNVLGPDFSLRFAENHRLFGQSLYSTTEEKGIVPDEEDVNPPGPSTRDGSSSVLGYEYSGDNKFLALTLSKSGHEFANDLGFMTENGIKTVDLFGQYLTGLKSEALHLSDLLFKSVLQQKYDVNSGRMIFQYNTFEAHYVTDSWVTVTLGLTPHINERVADESDLQQENSRKIGVNARFPKYLTSLGCDYVDGLRLVYSEGLPGNRKRTSCSAELNLGDHVSAQFYHASETYYIPTNDHLLREDLSTGTLKYFINPTDSVRLTGQDRKTETFEGRTKDMLWTALLAHQPSRGVSVFLGGSRATGSYDIKDGFREYFVKTSCSI